ncbi:serine/threonine-protein kinase SAPK7-like isoform X2 [Trifolium pratense]|uniref:serine/threonine-protein kinase SAPK7-like isoform X2 n=1 Tax=Trifolium pratense TaxID=57577 RepID=UPI001E6910FD|nr:serine/threonine-protein kinase SAPK7-like isoform X2 [Trifolium pratense]
MEKYEEVKDIGDGNYSVVKLIRHIDTKSLFAVKYIPRGHTVFLSPTHIAIVMEYAASGDLFDYVCSQGTLSEDKARYVFQQLISGVSYCHDMEICHRDLKLENTLLDGKRIRICDFGFSKSYLLHSTPNSRIGTPSYIAPEIFSGKEYNGKLADIWSCGVMLYIMLVGELPFGDQKDLQNLKKTMNKIMLVQYKIPDTVHISQHCRNLISRIFVANPMKRISMREIKSHPWFLENLPKESIKEAQDVNYTKENPIYFLQSIEEIMNIIEEAKILATTSSSDQLEDLTEALKKM